MMSSTLFCSWILDPGFHVAVNLFSNRLQKMSKCSVSARKFYLRAKVAPEDLF